MRNYSVDLEKYNEILQHVFEHESTYINSGLFYKDIDESISTSLGEIPLRLIK
jgi:hypothetical protein